MSPHCTFLRAGDLSAIVGDDIPRGTGGGQYSGVWSLVHPRCPASPFQAAYAGLIAGAHRGTGPTLEPIDDTSARLVRSPTNGRPHTTVRGTYALTAPHYVDYRYEVEYAADAPGEALPDCDEHLWCCYMNSPLDRSIHFIENDVWTTLTPVIHGEAAMVFPTGLDDAHRAAWEKRTGEARFAEQGGFHQSFSGRTFDYPMYFGVIHHMVFLIMADHHADFRFFISPSGAGYSAVPGQASPAWDFAWYVHNPKPGETRTLNVRVAYFAPDTSTVTQHAWDEWETFRMIHPTH